MTTFNSYETIALGVYGNGNETIFINQHGKAFIVQSSDMLADQDAIPTDNYLPADMIALGTADCSDLVIPEWVYDAN